MRAGADTGSFFITFEIKLRSLNLNSNQSTQTLNLAKKQNSFQFGVF